MPRHKNLSESEYLRYAREAVATYKKLPLLMDERERLGPNWGDIIGRHRDSDALANSNFEVIEADLKKRFPDDVENHRFGHFAVGWVEELLVRMFNDNGKLTPAGRAAVEWGVKIEDYPVADEDDFSRREFEESEEE